MVFLYSVNSPQANTNSRVRRQSTLAEARFEKAEQSHRGYSSVRSPSKKLSTAGLFAWLIFAENENSEGGRSRSAEFSMRTLDKKLGDV